jgi:hypothetical protein
MPTGWGTEEGKDEEETGRTESDDQIQHAGDGGNVGGPPVSERAKERRTGTPSIVGNDE